MIKGLEKFSYKERLGDLCLFRLEKSRLWEDLTAAYQSLKEAYKQKEPDFSHSLIAVGKWGMA